MERKLRPPDARRPAADDILHRIDAPAGVRLIDPPWGAPPVHADFALDPALE